MKKLESKVKDNFVEDSEERMSVRSLAEEATEEEAAGAARWQQITARID